MQRFEPIVGLRPVKIQVRDLNRGHCLYERQGFETQVALQCRRSFWAYKSQTEQKKSVWEVHAQEYMILTFSTRVEEHPSPNPSYQNHSKR